MLRAICAREMLAQEVPCTTQRTLARTSSPTTFLLSSNVKRQVSPLSTSSGPHSPPLTQGPAPARLPSAITTVCNPHSPLADGPGGQEVGGPDDLLQARTTFGTSRVVCFSPRHDLTVAEMTVPALRAVVDALRDESIALSSRYAVVQIFENRGACRPRRAHGRSLPLN